MHFLFALLGDSAALVLFYRAFKSYRKPQQKMFETTSDFAMRRRFSLLLMLVALAAIWMNHHFNLL